MEDKIKDRYSAKEDGTRYFEINTNENLSNDGIQIPQDQEQIEAKSELPNTSFNLENKNLSDTKETIKDEKNDNNEMQEEEINNSPEISINLENKNTVEDAETVKDENHSKNKINEKIETSETSIELDNKYSVEPTEEIKDEKEKE